MSAVLSRRALPLGPDEIIEGVSCYNFSHRQGLRYSLYDDIFAPSAYGVTARLDIQCCNSSEPKPSILSSMPFCRSDHQ